MPQGSPIAVHRTSQMFSADDKRVIARFFQVGGEQRILNILRRVAELNEAKVEELVRQVCADFSPRHRKIEFTFKRNYEQVAHYIRDPESLTADRKLLIGSYFTMEYAIESAALFNPSIVPHPDQSGAGPGELRFIMSLRATGEGHVSSIVFRTGTIDRDGGIRFDPAGKYAAKMQVNQDRRYEKRLFFLKLIEMAAYTDAARVILDELPAYFTYLDLDHKIAEIKKRPHSPRPFSETAENMLWLARSNYKLIVPRRPSRARSSSSPPARTRAAGSKTSASPTSPTRTATSPTTARTPPTTATASSRR